MINARHLSIILTLLCAVPTLRAQSSLIDTAGLAARIPFPPDARIVDKPIEVRFSARLNAYGTVDSVIILDTAHRTSPFGDAVRKIVGARARNIDALRAETVEMTASFDLVPVNGRRLKRVNVRMTASGAGAYSEGGASGPDTRPAIAERKSQPAPVATPPAEPVPDPDEFVPVEMEASCDMNDLARRVHYPEEARRHGVQGTVEVRSLVDKTGKVVRIIVERSDNPLLNDAAVEAVRNTPFKPAIQKGKPVVMWVTIPIRFSLN